MTTATKTTQTENATIQITLTRKVSDKVNYSDGYEIKMGREVYEAYDVTITSRKSGKAIHTMGKPGDFAFFALASKYQKMPAGAFARVGDAYINQALYDTCMAMIAELDAEVSKTDEQVAIETAQVEARAYVAVEPEHGQNGHCRKCHSYCYGDCDSH